MTPWYRFLTDFGDRGGEFAIRSNRRAALAIRAEQILISRAEIRKAAMTIRAEQIIMVRAEMD